MNKRNIIYVLLFVMVISLGVLNISCSTNANADNEPKPADVSLDNYYTKDEIDTMLSDMLDNDYGVLRIESLDTSKDWYISIDNEYIGRPLTSWYIIDVGFVIDFYEKSVLVGNHVISGYRIFQNDPAVNMAPQTVYVPSQGLTFRPSSGY